MPSSAPVRRLRNGSLVVAPLRRGRNEYLLNIIYLRGVYNLDIMGKQWDIIYLYIRLHTHIYIYIFI